MKAGDTGKVIGIYRRLARNAARGASVAELLKILEEGLDCHVKLEEQLLEDDPQNVDDRTLSFNMYGKLANYSAISLVREDAPFSQAEAETAEYMTDIVAITIADHERAEAIRWQATKGLVTSLLDGSYSDSLSIAETANTIAFDIDGPHRVMSIETNRSAHNDKDGEKLRFDRMMRGAERIANEIAKHAGRGLALKMEERIVVLIHDPHENRFEETARAVAEELLATLEDEYPKTRFTVCIGSVCTSYTQYEDAYRLVEQVAELNKSVGKGRKIVSLKQFGAKALFYSALRPEALLQFTAVRLKPLIEYDRKQSGSLLKTLRIYLDCGGNVSQAAQQLFISYSGMRYRLREIERLTNLNLKDPNVSYEMFFALDVLEIAGEEAVLNR